MELRPFAVSIGHRLKEAREKKGLAIDQVQKQTKIHSTVIIALEEGRASELLTDTYVRSFLKKYAQFLGINSVDLLKEYFPARAEMSTSNTPAADKHLTPEMSVAPKFIYITAIAAAAVVLMIISTLLISHISSSLKQSIAAHQKKAALAKKTKPASGTKVTPKKKSAAQRSNEIKEIIPRTTPLTLTIRVKEPVLVRLKKDGVLMFDNVLRRDLVETVTANNNIELGIGKAQAIELTLNGRPISLPTNKAILGLEITRKGVRLK